MLDKTDRDYDGAIPPTEAVKDIAVELTIQSQVNQRRVIIMRTFIGRDDPLRAHNLLSDKLSSVIDRQEAKFDLQGVQISLLQAQQNLQAAVDQAAAIEAKAVSAWDARKKGPFKLTATEDLEKKKHESHIKNSKANIAKHEQEIAELEAKIAKVD